MTPGHRGLRLSLRAGAAYDLILALFILTGGPAVMAALQAPVDAFRFHFLLSALPLVVLSVLYATAARTPDPDPFRIPVLWARAGGGGLLILLALFLDPPAAALFILVGVVDLGWAILHALLWARASR